ncbi:hypothetical protein DMA12_01465 [Amycolatopsis balhimycina DSM 5908]|uniref:Uncharacterized protein n=1 Tax=Amycolatopsis balhimycina DSM 5908 TaxID=1081091 RepID=A0A428X6B3_AMYBA|nr:hypothetical protein [Amycolatopsis balhimycina]RSM50839.1 hypothetical protein DMA12_01465 [Amycolatopsis balhimycina DSM 5908]
MFNFLRRLVVTSALVATAAGGGGAYMFAGPAYALGPSNDDVANAASLVGVSGQYAPSLNNSSASAEPGEPAHYVNGQIVRPANHSVWFKWTAHATAEAVFRSQGSKFDTVLAVYQQFGSGFSGLVQMGSNDDTDFAEGHSLQSQVSFVASQGQEYLIAVDSYNSTNTGGVTLTWTGNDDFHGAQPLSGPLPGSNSIVGLSNEGATHEIQERAHAGDPATHSVWFAWQAPRTGMATFESTLDKYDTQLAVYTGDNVAALNLVTENDNTPSGRQARVTFPAVAGTTYMIALDGVGDQRGRTVIQYSLP